MSPLILPPLLITVVRWSSFAALCGALLALSIIDLRSHRLPNPLVALVAVTTIAPSLFWTIFSGNASFLLPVGGGFIAAVLPIAIIELVWRFILHKPSSGIGGGDIKLLAALGLGLAGWGLLLLPFAALLSLPQAIFSAYRKHKKGAENVSPSERESSPDDSPGYFAFGPYLSLAALLLYLIAL